MTKRCRSVRVVDKVAGRGPGAISEPRNVRALLPALLAVALLATACLSSPAWARVAAGPTPAGSETKAPKVTKQPVSVTVEEGQSTVFEATASGVPAPTVQWELSTNGGGTWSAVAGATANQLTIADPKTSESGDELRAAFNNVAGQATSKAVTLTVRKAPVVTKQPLNVTVEEGQNAVFEAAAAGFPTPNVQWEFSTNGGGAWSNVAGATADQLTVVNTKTSDSGREYRAAFKNVAGQATSEAATLTVRKAPVVTKQPVSVTVEEGQSAVFEASASGVPAPSVQWELSTNSGSTWSAVEGATSDQLTVANAKTSENGDEYRAVFDNAAGQATSAAATLTVHKAPAVTEQPASATVDEGQSAVFEAMASGFPTPSVQWEVSTNGGATWTPVAGATTDQLTVANTKASENGDEYRAVFENVAGKATSQAVTLTVATSRYDAVGWGENISGQLGDGNTSDSDVPVTVSDLNFVTSVAAGRRHSLALLANGTVMAWGENASGQLGDGTNTMSEVPVAVEGLTGVKAIAAGYDHSLALLSNGTVMAWGANEAGQLGDASFNESNVPVAVQGLTKVTAVSAGDEYSVALLSNGTVMAWGNGEHGQLGDGKTGNSDVPVAVKAVTGATAVSAGGEHSLALLGDGTVMAWGEDDYGQLGNSAVTNEEEEFSDSPVAVLGLSSVEAVAAGGEHSLALLSGGTVMAWGEDEYGQLGDGSIARSEQAPVPVSGLSGVNAISAAGENSLALLSGGTVVAWGEDRHGELGDGSAGEPSDVPVAVSGLSEVSGISAGGFHDLAYGEAIPSVTGVSPSGGPSTGGTSVSITGAHFTGATAVRFGANNATSFSVNSPSSITAVAPAGVAGTVDVTVTTPAGTSPSAPADRFTYVASPTVTKLSAKDGSAAGGTPVTITGTSLEGATSVSFGATSAKSFTVESATSITAISPAATGGKVDVRVTTPSGTSAISKADLFKLVPAIESLSPHSGATAGATAVIIAGAGFAPGTSATSFTFGGKQAASVECTSSTSCMVLTPANSVGTVEVLARVNKVKSPRNPPGDQFTYE